MSFLFFLSLFFLKDFQNRINDDVMNQVVTAGDFAVEITNLPRNFNVRELKANVWCWSEFILNSERNDAVNLQTEIYDEN